MGIDKGAEGDQSYMRHWTSTSSLPAAISISIHLPQLALDMLLALSVLMVLQRRSSNRHANTSPCL